MKVSKPFSKSVCIYPLMAAAFLLSACSVVMKAPAPQAGTEVDRSFTIRNGDPLLESATGIVMGYEAVGRVRFGNNPPHCTGILVGKRHVLTAAHCLGNVGDPMYYGGPANSLLGATKVIRQMRHHDYSAANFGTVDLAMLILESNRSEAPQKLTSKTQPTTPVVSGVGFGIYTNSNGTTASANVPRFGQFNLVGYFPLYRPITINSFLLSLTADQGYYHSTGGSSGQQICAGDSGGPLYDGKDLIGLATFVAYPWWTEPTAVEICREATDAGHLVLAPHLPWIKSAMQITEPATPERWVARSYLDVLKREASAAEIASWANRLRANQITPLDVSKAFVRSPEYLKRIIREKFQAILIRPPTASEESSYLARLTAGRPLNEMTAELLATGEYSTEPAYIFAGRLYVEIFGRFATESEVQYTESLLLAGTSKKNIALALFSALEARQNTARHFYRTFLRRDPIGGEDGFYTDLGYLTWTNQLALRDTLSVLTDFVVTPEYVNTRL